MNTKPLVVLGLLAACCFVALAQDAEQILEGVTKPPFGLPDADTFAPETRLCDRLLGTAGVRGGLVVVLGCDRPSLLAELRATGPYLVHGLDRDLEKVAAARNYLLEKKLYGSVTVSQWEGTHLPFVDGVVNLVVIGSELNVTRDELLRVLAPGGVSVKLKPGTRHLKADTFFRKPWPTAIDQWPQFLHDASNNAVSNDTIVDPPKGLRWTCGPKYARSHEHLCSVSAMVTAGGRLFYIIDEGPISSIYLPPKWKLVARDAFSGVLLWERAIENWEAHLRGFRSGPPEIGRRLVATSDRVYAALNYGDPVTVLDAATGQELAAAPRTEGARELLLAGGTLFLLADDMTAGQHSERRKAINGDFLHASPDLSIWQRLPRKPYPIYGKQQIIVVRTDDHRHAGHNVSGAAAGTPSADGGYALLWEKPFHTPGEVLPTTLAVDNGKVCFQTVSHVVCLDALTGKELWRAAHPVATSRFSWSTPTLVMHDGVVLVLDRKASGNVSKAPPNETTEWIVSSGGRDDRQDAELVAYSADAGTELWRAAYSENYNSPGDIFVISGVVWVGNLRAGTDPGFTEGRDLRTGKLVKTLPPQKGWGHHRCYRNKATVRWLLVGRGGVQFIDAESGAVIGNSWYRGACQYGIMPANGLLYTPQHSCACQPEELLTGLNALSPKTSEAVDSLPQLEKGPAFGSSPAVSADRSAHDWPTYRCDVRRSGYQNVVAPRQLTLAWKTQLTPPLTAPVVAGGRVFVAEKDRHALQAYSCADGKLLWTFVADGRIDSPPTVSAGRCLFGTRNGYVYCLRASDGALMWRFRAAPRDRRLFSYGQLESVWPVHGSVLVDERPREGDGARRNANLDSVSAPSGYGTRSIAYFAAGRSARLDGGIRLYALDVGTGQVLHQAAVCLTGRPTPNVIRQSVLPDIVSLQNGVIWMRGLGVARNLKPVPDKPHLFAPRGFLDDTWWHRTYWLYGTKMGASYSHWPDAGNAEPAGRLLAFDDGKRIYGYGRMHYRVGDGHVRADATKDYKLFAEVLAPEPQIIQDRRGETKLGAGRREIKWATTLPFVAKSIVLTRDALLVAGGPSLPGAPEHDTPGILWIASRDDGTRQEGCPLPAPPVLDGMAVTDSGVLVSMTDGSVACLRSIKGEQAAIPISPDREASHE